MNEHEGKLCVRFYRRHDGTMMTKDCPVGWRAAKQRVVMIAGAAAVFCVGVFSMLMFGVFAAISQDNDNRDRIRWVNPIQRVQEWLKPPVVVLGGACLDPIPPAPPPNHKELL